MSMVEDNCKQGPKTVALTWVKGHTTDEDIEDGKGTETREKHNNSADTQANIGVRTHANGIEHIAQHITKRSQNYNNIMQRIKSIVITMIRQEQQIRTADPSLEQDSTNTTRDIDIHKAIDWNTDDTTLHTLRIHDKRLHTAPTPPSPAQRKQVRTFLHNIEIKIGGQHDPRITWLELLIAFENQHGEFAAPPIDPQTGRPEPPKAKTPIT